MIGRVPFSAQVRLRVLFNSAFTTCPGPGDGMKMQPCSNRESHILGVAYAR
jgi:hypothetical protein